VNERGENAVLVIDEAQTLSTSALEAIRLLTNLETDQHKLLQIVLVGQPELEKKLEDQQLRQLAQRITTRAYLTALNMLEMMQYVNHRICVANGGGKVFFDPKAYRLLHKETHGYPRLINLVCHRALLASYVRETSVVDGDAISQAIADLKGKKFRPRWMWLKQLVFS
jgi:general secretion pathway protein A